MEGILWKWTNYWSGWQPRWFVLDNGVLSYYKSQEEVNQGCKGSIKMSVCEINVHPTDTTRLDLVIPTEQHFYLKSATTQERQQWLVALGSAKASLGVRQKKDSSTHKTAPDTLKVKKSELRLYCDLLMQQVHTVKTTATGTHSLDDEALNEATSLLGATCDTFIKTLEECMKLANANFAYELPHQLIADSALPPSAVAMTSNNSHIKNNRTIHRSSSADRTLPATNVHFRDARSNSVEHYEIRQRQPSVEEEPTEHKPQSICLTDDHVPSDQEFSDAQDMNGESSDRYLHHSPEKSKVLHKESSDHENNNHDEMATVVRKTPQIETFFSNLKVSFLNMKLKDDGGIPTKHFLESCAIVITIFEMFGSPIFIPMKSDVMGNLKKIRTKHNIDTKRFDTLQSIVLYEMEMETTAAKDSATDALMWLKRGLEFVYEFLLEFSRGNPDLKLACLNAYNRSLKQYHGWIIRGIITTATRTVPSRQEVLTKLAVNLNDVNNPNYDDELKMDAQRFIKAMSTIIRILNDFYMENSLDKKEVV